MKIRDVTTSRLRHSVAEAGVGEPLMLVHGFTGAKEDFADFLDGFADRGWHVVAPDLRGHGASDAPAEETAYSLAEMAADVRALADELGWERFDLLGHSMGGMVAQVLALEVPERLRSLVLMDTGHGPVEGLDPVLLALAVEVVRTEGVDRLIELANELGPVGRPRSPSEERVREERAGYVDFGDRKLRAAAPAMYAAMAQGLSTVEDRLAALRTLDVRTLVVVGEEDEGFAGPSERLAEAIPGATLEVIADAAHSPQFENPDRWWKVVSRFLEAGRQADPAG
ncbi:alpha/beta hydrolase [Iamia sp. SCSIO 61187]|uniref:alpha/beta fold hydrolase n=1 Tax=Iamia sp. SCSIO 61187 TaxID=2722752 RepID=UPI001C636AE1|nr:alpha/beta hydrolase [Iamia sp. SCSIO 61187]QYG93908.1 alpha/beta hydrolase [Iamia sp. SCSIO 61187]